MRRRLVALAKRMCVRACCAAETLRAQYNLALCLKQKKKLGTAAATIKLALYALVLERLISHRVCVWLAGADEAQSLYERVVSGWLAQLGPRHAHTLHAQYGLALVLRDRGLRTAARTAYENVIEGYGAVYGSLHPLTITAQKAAQALR